MASRRSARASTISSWILPYPELKYDGIALTCDVCNMRLNTFRKSDIERHVNSSSHHNNRKKGGPLPQTDFYFDLALMMICANIPWSKLNNIHFKSFLQKYCVGQHIPDESTLRKEFLTKVYEQTVENMRNYLQGDCFWVSIDETTDSLGRKIVHLLLMSLCDSMPKKSHLIASKVLEKVNSQTICQFYEDTLNWFWGDFAEINKQKILLFTSDSVAYMLKAGRQLKSRYTQLLHITCFAHGLHRLCEKIRCNFKNVDKLIANVKKVFLKAPSRIKYFKQKCPGLQLPPQPTITRWGTWIDAACYYADHFEDIQEVINTLPEESSAIKKAKHLLSLPNLKKDFIFIKNNFKKVAETIVELENSKLPINESFKKIENVQEIINNISGGLGETLKSKYSSILKRNPDFEIVKEIKEKIITDVQALWVTDIPLSKIKYAPMTTVDCERSFSVHKWILNPRRNRLNKENLEKIITVLFNSIDI